jgi:hypothetical protein
MVPPGLSMSLSVPLIATLYCYVGWGGHTLSWPTQGKMCFAGRTLSKDQGQPQTQSPVLFVASQGLEGKRG